MTSESGSSEGRRWLVEPPGPQQISIQIATGDQVEVTPELRRAFDGLLQALNAGEIEGYTAAFETGAQVTFCTVDCTHYLTGCTSNIFNCTPRRKCMVETQAPCLIDYHCAIAP
jgi:hypothetical protein